MGQQQLLLLVLGVVIVGLATVIGLDAYAQKHRQVNADALVDDAIRVAAQAQTWRITPRVFGGGLENADATPWAGASFGVFGLTVDDDGKYITANGLMTLAVAGTTLTLTAENTDLGNQIVVTVNGLTPHDITTTVNAATGS